MDGNNIGNLEKSNEKHGDTTYSFRISIESEILKKINIASQLKGFDGKQNENISKIIFLAINHYYKEVTVPELQSLTTNE